MASLLVGCGASPDETLNATLPKLSLRELLPQAVANEYCNLYMDSDLLYGIGYQLYNDEKARASPQLPDHGRAHP